MDGYIDNLVEGMFCYIGQTVTIFTTSGGLSGNGFTGVLISADCNVVRLLCESRSIIKPTQKTLDLSSFQRVGHF